MEPNMLKTLAVSAFVIASTVQIAHAQVPASWTTPAGAVFTATNAASGNEVVMWSRDNRGRLTRAGRFATSGRGEGGINDPMRSSYSVTLTADHSTLLVVNAGSSDISVFQVLPTGLVLTSLKPSTGGNPISIAVHGNLVYVVNFGGTYQLAGFALQASGTLRPIKNSLQVVSSADGGASSAVLSPDGAKLVVTERVAGKVDVFDVGSDGTLSNPVFNTPPSTKPFSEAFTPSGTLLVTDTGAVNGSATLSSYAKNADNTLSAISSAVPTGGTAACWLVADGQDALTSNAGSGNLGALAIAPNGTLQ
jgi:6-phosphogluconolactonase